MNTVKVGDPATPLHASHCCAASSPDGFSCTEPVGHSGDHVACGTSQVMAVWS